MKEFENSAYFWQKVDTLLAACNIDVKWTKGSEHPDVTGAVFPLDSGMLELDGSNVAQFYKGCHGCKVDGLVMICDILDKQFRTVVLIGCNESEQDEVCGFIDSSEFKKCVLMRRGNDVAVWSERNNEADYD